MTKRFTAVLMSAVFTFLLVSNLTAGESVPEAKVELLVLSSKADADLADRAGVWIKSQLASKISITHDTHGAAETNQYTEFACVVSFQHEEERKNSPHQALGVCISNSVAVILVDELTGEDIGSDRLISRAEKSALFAACRMLGLKTCPFPRCVMLPCKTEKQLDLKARGLCPPCSAKMDALLQKRLLSTSGRER